MCYFVFLAIRGRVLRKKTGRCSWTKHNCYPRADLCRHPGPVAASVSADAGPLCLCFWRVSRRFLLEHLAVVRLGWRGDGYCRHRGGPRCRVRASTDYLVVWELPSNRPGTRCSSATYFFSRSRCRARTPPPGSQLDPVPFVATIVFLSSSGPPVSVVRSGFHLVMAVFGKGVSQRSHSPRAESLLATALPSSLRRPAASGRCIPRNAAACWADGLRPGPLVGISYSSFFSVRF